MAALLEVQDLSVHFGGLAAVKNVTFTIEQGERLVMIGPNGAGKTTLFNLLTGQLKPTGGKVAVQGAGHHAQGGATRARNSAWRGRSRSPACSPTRPC